MILEPEIGLRTGVAASSVHTQLTIRQRLDSMKPRGAPTSPDEFQAFCVLDRSTARAFLTAMGSAGESWLTGGPPRIIAFAPAAFAQGGWTLTWQAVPGRKYDIEASNDLEDWSYVVAADYAATAATASIVIVPAQPPPANGFYDAGLSGASHRFYRVRWNR